MVLVEAITGALMRRLDDGASKADRKPRNMYRVSRGNRGRAAGESRDIQKLGWQLEPETLERYFKNGLSAIKARY